MAAFFAFFAFLAMVPSINLKRDQQKCQPRIGMHNMKCTRQSQNRYGGTHRRVLRRGRRQHHRSEAISLRENGAHAGTAIRSGSRGADGDSGCAHAPCWPMRLAASTTKSILPSLSTSMGLRPRKRSSGCARKFRIVDGLTRYAPHQRSDLIKIVGATRCSQILLGSANALENCQ